VLIGASGVGKSSIAKQLYEAGSIEPAPTLTTRALRPGEIETPYDHRFVSDTEFDRLEAAGKLIAVAPFYGARYAVPFSQKPASDTVPLIILKPIFMPAFLRQFPKARVCHIDASPEVLPERMRSRGQSEADIAERMALHAEESAAAKKFAHVSFLNNGPLEETLRQVRSQIDAENT